MEKLFQILDIKPQKKELFIQAFTHKTFSNENRKTKHYEMLEFVGDALIQLKSSIFIYKNFPNLNEGQATLIRSQTVDTNSLAYLSNELNLKEYLRVSKGALEILENKKINADLFESLAAAIYLDLGEKELELFLGKTLYKIIIEKAREKDKKDPKSTFQELVQTHKKTGEYRTYKFEEKQFKSELHFEGNIYGIGFGKTKKEAETNAAKEALKILQKGKNEIN